MHPQPDDTLALIARLRRGDESAMATLYDRYSPLVYAVALRVLADTTAAEDVMQDLFMQLWRNPQLYDATRGKLGAWLAVSARHRAVDVLRKRRPQTDLEDVVVSSDVDLESESTGKLIAARVKDLMAAMPPEQRTALDLAFFQGLTHTEIAAKTGEPLGTIKTRIRAALISVRAALNPQPQTMATVEKH